ncbi:hypothetical protein IR194_03220 [Exiguobacterium sp. PBE]|nr:hypothetical protein IR194_03220 [Exiguobacterium sp. PBE]
MAKKKQFVTAAAAFAVAASAVAPAITADAASTTVQLASDYVRGGDLDAALDKEYKGSEIYWYKSSVDMNKLGVFQTAKGFVKGQGIRVEKKLRVLNHAQDIQPEEIVLEEGVPASGLRIQPVLFADGVKYNKVVTYKGFSTEKAGEFEGTFTYSNKAFGVVTKTVKYKVVATKVELSEVKSEVMDDVLSVTADVKNLKDGEKVELVVYANRDMNAALPAVQAEVKDGKLTVKSGKLPAGNHSFILRSGEVKTDVMNFVVEAPMVKEVKAINAKQLQVTFNKAIDSSVIDTDGSIIDGAIALTKISGAGTGAITDASVAKLSEDKMSVIIDASARLEGQYLVTLAADKVKTTSGKSIAAYTSNVFNVEDKVAPAVSSVTNLNASVVRVKFSEPLSSVGSWTFKLADGSNATVSPTFSAGNDYVDLTIDGGIANGSQITATILGAADYAGNLITPNPTTINFVKGVKDGVKPTVTSVTAVGLDKFEVKFSEKVQNVSVEDFSVSGKTITSVTQDSSDATKYVVALDSALTVPAGQTSVLATVVVNATADTPAAGTNITDLSGERFDGFSRIVEFKKDTVAPKLVKSEVKKENGEEVLFLTFDEVVTKGNVDALAATQLKDFVTTTDDIDLDGSANDKLVAVAGDAKSLKVKLSDVTFNGSALVQGAEYTVTLANFTDAASNALANTSIKFVRGTDADTTKPVPTVGTITNDTIQITFDRPLDGASAVNKANYSINGLAIDTVTLKPGNVVELKLVSGTNTLNGLRNLSIANVKSKDGVAMDNFMQSVSLVENVKPAITKAEYVDLSTIRVTFSEDVEYTTVAEVAAEADFALKLDGVDFTNTLTEVMAADGKTMTITLGTPVDATQYAKTLTVVPTADFDIEDLNGNKAASFTSVTVSK